MEKYKLPEGWKWVEIEEVAHVIQGRSPNKADYSDAGAKVLKFRDVTSNGICWKNAQRAYVPDTTAETRKLRTVLEGDILITSASHTGKSIGTKLALVEDVPKGFNRVYFVAELLAIRPNQDAALSKWLMHWLWSDDGQECVQAAVEGVHLTRGRAQTIPVPLPPLPEQKRIVARIEELASRVRKAKELVKSAREDAEKVIASLLHHIFSQADEKGWKWVKLGEVFELQQGASMSPGRRLWSNPKPFLRVKNVRWCWVDLTDVDEMDFTEEEVRALALRPGDLLVCEGGEVGRTAIWSGELPLCLYQNHIHRLRAPNEYVEPKFIMYWILAAYKVFLSYGGEESTTAIPNLSGSRLKRFEAPPPPPPEQKRIVARIEEVQKRVDEARKRLEEMEDDLKKLESSILSAAFHGEL